MCWATIIRLSYAPAAVASDGRKEDRYLYRRHRWRSEGYHGEAKAWHGLARAVRRGLQNMRIQAFLTAAAINLKRLAAAFVLYLLCALRWRASEMAPGRPVALRAALASRGALA